MSMTFTEFSEINRLRCESPQGFNHPIDSWSLSDWMVAASGELGEAANFVKKLNRVKDGVVGNTESEGELRLGLAKEIADTVAYLDLLAQSQGWDLGTIVQSKFEEVSERIGYMSPPPQEKEPTGFLSIYSNQSVDALSTISIYQPLNRRLKGSFTGTITKSGTAFWFALLDNKGKYIISGNIPGELNIDSTSLVVGGTVTIQNIVIGYDLWTRFKEAKP